MTVGGTIGTLGMAAGVALGFTFLFFREQVLWFIKLVTGQNIWDPSVRFFRITGIGNNIYLGKTCQHAFQDPDIIFFIINDDSLYHLV